MTTGLVPDGPLRMALDDLAAWVAGRLEAGELLAAWTVTLGLDGRLGDLDGTSVPPMPVIGRRFARVHARLLTTGDALPETERDEIGCAS